jgi:hypothetical protein
MPSKRSSRKFFYSAGESNMASNPQFPEQKRPPREQRPQVVRKIQVPRKRPFPWPVIALMVAAAILIALIAWLPRTPKAKPGPSAAEIPVQPTAGQIQLSHFRMTAAPVGNAFYMDGQLFNNGDTALTGVQVQARFLGADGQTVEVQSRPVGEVTDRSGTNSQNLVQDPVKPHQSRPIRIYFDQIPANWNRQMPEIAVTTVTATKP